MAQNQIKTTRVDNSHKGNFAKSLELSHECEKIALKYLQRKFPNAFIRKGYFKEHDIYIPEIEKSVEVKLDLVARETGNFGIEIFCNGRPSGISTTNADKWFIFQDPDDTFLSISVEKLKDLCRKYKGERRISLWDNPAELIVIPCLELIMEAKIILARV